VVVVLRSGEAPHTSPPIITTESHVQLKIFIFS
jgi:hypothetical protein